MSLLLSLALGKDPFLKKTKQEKYKYISIEIQSIFFVKNI